MNEPKKLDLKTIIEKSTDILHGMQHYSLLIFVIFVAAVYGFIFLQINSYGSAEPSSDAVSSQVKASQTPHIDQYVVTQLLTLQDNSVNVQTLFDNARSNPFQ